MFGKYLDCQTSIFPFVDKSRILGLSLVFVRKDVQFIEVSFLEL